MCIRDSCDAVQAMYNEKKTPDAGGQYSAAPQVIRLREKCTGTPVERLYPYATPHKIHGYRQFNTLAHCRVQLAVQRYSTVMTTRYETINLFGIHSSQESHDDPPPPPPKRRHDRKHPPEEESSARRSVISEEGEGGEKRTKYYGDYKDEAEYDGCI